MTRRLVSPSHSRDFRQPGCALAFLTAALCLMTPGVDPAAAGPIHRVALDPSLVQIEPEAAGSGKVRIDYPGAVAAPAGEIAVIEIVPQKRGLGV